MNRRPHHCKKAAVQLSITVIIERARKFGKTTHVHVGSEPTTTFPEGFIPAVVRHTFQRARCGYKLRVTHKHHF